MSRWYYFYKIFFAPRWVECWGALQADVRTSRQELGGRVTVARNQLLVDLASSCQPLLVLWYTLKYTVTVSVTVGGVYWYIKVHKPVANHRWYCGTLWNIQLLGCTPNCRFQLPTAAGTVVHFEIHSYRAVHQGVDSSCQPMLVLCVTHCFWSTALWYVKA